MAILTFLDSSVLIAAHRGQPTDRESALAIINDPSRKFIATPFLYLETMPKALYSRSREEIDLYQAYFDSIRVWINDLETIVSIAREESERHGLAAMDAMHVAAAYLAEADVLLTLERRTKPIYRTSLVRVAYLEPVV